MIARESPTEYFERLMAIAKQNRVAVKFLHDDVARGIDWDGLYVVTRELGAGIAIRSGLAPDWRDWVLAHELGHHFGQLNGTLFSPFRAHKVDSLTRDRWSKAARLDPDEERANEWAVTTLVSDNSWDAAERASPTDLRQIVSRLGLPLPAAVAWERRRRRKRPGVTVRVSLSPQESTILERPISGQGGHQSFFSRLKPKCGLLEISYSDFSFARERVVIVEGGWLARYRAVLGAVGPLIEVAGTSSTLFRICPTPEGALKP